MKNIYKWNWIFTILFLLVLLSTKINIENLIKIDDIWWIIIALILVILSSVSFIVSLVHSIAVRGNFKEIIISTVLTVIAGYFIFDLLGLNVTQRPLPKPYDVPVVEH